MPTLSPDVGRLILSLAVVALACGRLPNGNALSGGTASPTPAETPSSPLAAAITSLTAGLAFQPYVPDGLPADLAVTASLFGSPALGPRGLGDPVLSIEVSKTAGTKPWLRIAEGAEGCCPDFSKGTPRDVTIRAGSGGTEPLVGQLYPPLGASEGPMLHWREPSASGAMTEIVLYPTTFGQYASEQALIDLARAMRPIARGTATDVMRLYLSTHVSHSPTGHRVYLATRSGPFPDDARLLDTSGATISTARFGPPQSYGCLAEATGVAAFAVPHDVVNAFSSGTATAYRAEVLVGGRWRKVQLIMSGCFSIE